MEHTYTNIIREFYQSIAFLLRYDGNEETVKAEKEILKLLCEIHHCQTSTDEIWEHIELARNLQLCSDEALLETMSPFVSDVAITLKLEVLQTHQIDRTKKFNPVIFTSELKEAADLGSKDACKLLAYLDWLGYITSENKQVAIKIWSALAANGDWEAISALVYAYDQNGNVKESGKWRNILMILKSEYESFSSVALSSKYKSCSAEEVQFANLIMFIRQKNAGKSVQSMDRPMIHYVLESKDNFEYKMERIASDTNYYLVMKMEDRYAGKKFGF